MLTTPLAAPLGTAAVLPCPAPTGPACPLSSGAGAVPALAPYLARVPDHRHRRGLRHPLVAVLALVTCALLCGTRHLQAIADWGRDHSPDLMTALGFTHPKTPCVATLHNVLADLDWAALEAALCDWAHALAAELGLEIAAETLQEAALAEAALAVDGKTLRGAWKMSAAVTHLVSVVGHQLGLTLGVAEVPAGDEIAAVEEILQRVVLAGKVVTLDALHTQRDTARLIGARGGHYVMTVKGNQPQLQAAVVALFAPEQAWEQDRQSASERSRGHGRVEERWLLAVSLREGILDWPGAAQAFVIERKAWQPKRKKLHRELLYGITSLPRAQAGPGALLRLLRGHWCIENRSHWVRDVTFGEDASLVCSGHLPQVLALLRTAVISRLRADGVTNIARETRRLAAQASDCLRLLGFTSNN